MFSILVILDGRKKLEFFLSGRPIDLMLCLDSTLARRLKALPKYRAFENRPFKGQYCLHCCSFSYWFALRPGRALFLLVSVPILSMRGLKFHPEESASRFLHHIPEDSNLDTLRRHKLRSVILYLGPMIAFMCISVCSLLVASGYFGNVGKVKVKFSPLQALEARRVVRG
jgi:hypothetical protein